MEPPAWGLCLVYAHSAKNKSLWAPHLCHSPCDEEEDVEGQRHSQGQPPPVPDEVGDEGQDQLPHRVTVTCYCAHPSSNTSGDPLHNLKWKNNRTREFFAQIVHIRPHAACIQMKPFSTDCGWFLLLSEKVLSPIPDRAIPQPNRNRQ